MLDPHVERYLEKYGGDLSPTEMTLEESRRLLEEAAPPSGIPIKRKEDHRIPMPGGEIPARVYIPDGDKKSPAIVYYHGGGWARGSLNTADNMCSAIASKTGFSVVSAGYRLAPEHIYPAGVNDSYRALEWAKENADRFGWSADCIAVAGDSAGGTMAAVIAQKARDEKGPRLACQVMICPATNLQEFNTPSYKAFAKGYLLSPEWMQFYRGLYVPDSSRWADPYVSPMLAKDLSGLPPALVITAEFDVLRDEAEDYCLALENAGVPAEAERYPGVIHDFPLLLPEIDASRKAFARAAEYLLATC